MTKVPQKWQPRFRVNTLSGAFERKPEVIFRKNICLLSRLRSSWVNALSHTWYPRYKRRARVYVATRKILNSKTLKLLRMWGRLWEVVGKIGQVGEDWGSLGGLGHIHELFQVIFWAWRGSSPKSTSNAFTPDIIYEPPPTSSADIFSNKFNL